jgi:ribosomal protein S27AE
MDDMNENVSWVFQKRDVTQPRLCTQCGDPLVVSWHGDTYDYGCANYACSLLYFGPPYTEAELGSDNALVLGPPNCPRCLMPMDVVPVGQSWQFACQQNGCDGIWPPTGP